MNLVKLVEIHSRGKNYNPETERCDVDYSLREVYINPSYVTMLREDDHYTAKHHDIELIEGLAREQNFSKLFLENSNSAATTISVVGDLKTVADKLKGPADV